MDGTPTNWKSKMSFDLKEMSYTFLSQYRRCPQSFLFSQVLAIPVPMPWALFFGRCWHEAMAEAFIAIEIIGVGEEDIASQTSLKIAADAFERWWDGGVTPEFFRGVVNFTDVIDWSDNDPEELRRLGLAMVESYLTKLAPKIVDLVGVEVVVSKDVKVAGGAIPFVSHLDLVTKSSIIDPKTSSRPWGKKRIAEDIQSTCYKFQMPEKEFYFHIGLKEYPIKWQVVQVHRTQAQLDELEFEMVPKTVMDIRAGIFPATECWVCPWCSYADICDR